MRPPATISPWLSAEELAVWVQEAPDKHAYQRRLAIWLTQVGPFHAAKIAELLQLSTPTIWAWVRQYNREGPEGLSRRGRGGRRWSFLSWEEELALLAGFEERALRGEVLTAKALCAEASRSAERQVSLGYVYRLLHRHHWRKLAPRPQHVKADLERQAEFKKNSLRSSKRS